MKSIRSRIQLWYMLLIVLVVTGMMFALHKGRRSQELAEFDLNLSRYCAAILPLTTGDAVGGEFSPRRRPRPRPEDGFRPPRHSQGGARPSRPEPRRENGFAAEGVGADSKGPDSQGFDAPRPAATRDKARNSEFAKQAESEGFFYVSWSPGGEEITRSGIVPDGLEFPGDSEGARREYRFRNGNREFISLAPRKVVVVAGGPVSNMEAHLQSYGWKLAGIGVLIVAGTFAVGWWILRIGLRPIETISDTAVEIAEGDLSKRIETQGSVSELSGLAGVLNDSFEKLESAFDQQRRFTADASHEMRTPISVILTKAQYALRKERMPEDYRKALESCVTSARHMSEVIESLQQLALIDCGSFTIEKEPCDLADTASGVVDLLTPLAVEKGIEIDADLPPCVCEVDSKRFRQVLINLVSNAIKYNRDGGTVKVRSNVVGENAVIEVVDTGKGIAEDDLPHIFDRFYRADRARTTRGNSGLGLAITKGIVDAHDGSIKVSSEIGVGTSFRITLPRHTGELEKLVMSAERPMAMEPERDDLAQKGQGVLDNK